MHLQTILFADLAGSTRLYQSEGDERAHMLVTRSLARMRQIIEDNSGELLRTVGDAVLASFGSTDDAFDASIKLQKAHANSSLSIRVGFHCGEVIPDDGDVYGNAVNIAARVADFAEANEICITHSVASKLSIQKRSNAALIDRIYFKGVQDPMRVYRVNWDGNDDGTAIVTSKGITANYGTDLVLDITIGPRTIRVSQDKPKISIGRSLENDILIEHDSTSRHHATIELVRGRYRLNDSSTNGSYVRVSGRKVEFARREALTLLDFGLIGLGWSPDDDESSCVGFRIHAELPT